MNRRDFTLSLMAAFAGSSALAQDRPGGIVSIGGSVTEIIFALGAGNQLVARDTTSTFPQAATALPDVGYMRALSPEGVLSVDPALIVAEEGAGPPDTIAILKAADVRFVSVPQRYTADGIASKIRTVGKAIGARMKAEALADHVTTELAQTVARSRNRTGTDKSVLFVLSTQGGRIMASGTGTAPAAMMEMAGARNAITGFEGYKPLTDEAVIAAAPDVILMMDRQGSHDSSPADLVALPSVAATPAGRTGAVIRMNGLYLLGFGPRTAYAVRDLHDALYGA